jgi:hypothetical protein
MITKLNTYEGVPIGGNNFEEFLEYVRGFLAANFGFSTNAVNNQGGFFRDDNFDYVDFGSGEGGGTSTYFFGPVSKDSGSLFGRYGNEFYRFEVLNPSVAPNINEWELLLTNSEEPSTIVFTNGGVLSRRLPYRPIYKTSNLDYRFGYQEVRLNGVPQPLTGGTYSFSYGPLSTFSSQSVTLTKIFLGAEHPSPVLNNTYTSAFTTAVAGQTTGVTRGELSNVNSFDSKVRFEYTNFSIDFGGHILLMRQVGSEFKYSYIPQDFSSGAGVAPGHYKVVEFSKGIISLNINNQVLAPLRQNSGEPFDNVNFTIISAEQLLEQKNSNSTTYHTKYGSVYDGSISNVRLIEYVFDGSNHVIQTIPQTSYVSIPGSVLLQDVSRQFADSVVLAISYRGNPVSSTLQSAQTTRYRPDVIKLYYHSAIIDTVSDDVKAIVEINENSWYNRDVMDAEYFPVNRTESANYALITNTEAIAFASAGIETFEPSFGFQIVDTIDLENLGDIGSLDEGDVLMYVGSGFEGVPFTLSGLTDTVIGIPTNNQVLAYSTGLSKWQPINISTIVDLTPVTARLDAIEANNWVTTSRINNSAVTSIKIADGAITNQKIADGTINGVTKLQNNTVTDDKINSLAGSKITGVIAASNIPPNAIDEAKLADNAVTAAKITGFNQYGIWGRNASGSGNPSSITASTNNRVLSRSDAGLSFTQINQDMIANLAITASKLSSGLYSAGTWTPSFNDTVDATIVTSANVSGYLSPSFFTRGTYVRLGNFVFYDFLIRLAEDEAEDYLSSSSAELRVTLPPFSVTSGTVSPGNYASSGVKLIVPYDGDDIPKYVNYTWQPRAGTGIMVLVGDSNDESLYYDGDVMKYNRVRLSGDGFTVIKGNGSYITSQ